MTHNTDPRRMTTVAVIPPGVTLDAALAALHGMGSCYPVHTLSLGNDPVSGAMRILYDPAAEPPSDGEPQPKVRLALGVDQPEDLLELMFSAGDDQDQALGVKALTVWMADLLEQHAAANYLTFTVELPEIGRYAVTIQRAPGKTPAERIAELEERIAGRSAAAQMVAEFHDMIGSPPWTGPITDMPAATLRTRNRLVRQEVRELVDATNAGDLVAIADACADVVYVVYGTAYTYAIDLDALVAEVHRSNMTKGPGPTGKAVKGDRYTPPDIAGVLARTGATAQRADQPTQAGAESTVDPVAEPVSVA